MRRQGWVGRGGLGRAAAGRMEGCSVDRTGVVGGVLVGSEARIYLEKIVQWLDTAELYWNTSLEASG